MAVKKNYKNQSGEQPKATPRRSAPKPAATVSAAKTRSYGDEDRAKLLSEKFCPEGLQFLKDRLGLDLTSRSVPISVVYDIIYNKVTKPVDIVVRPLAYDKDQKKVVEKDPIKACVSLRIVMPYDKQTHKPVAPSEKNRVFVASYPCYEYLVKASPDAGKTAPVPAAEAEGKDLPVFSNQEICALEGLGIREERLYANSFNAIPLDEKRAMLAGEAFDVNGAVRVADGTDDSHLNIFVNGRAKMSTDKNGVVKTVFETVYPSERQSNQTIDLLKARRIGNLELDFFDRRPDGKVKTDVYNNPILNKAARDLIRYGAAFCPVDGRIHTGSYNKEKRVWEDTVEFRKYTVSVVNGGLCAFPMKKEYDLAEDGSRQMVKIGGKEVEKYHWEAKVTVNGDGTVRINNQNLKPATRKDLDNYVRGFGARFVGCHFKDEKTKSETIADVFAVANSQNPGGAKFFSAKVSKELFESNGMTEESKNVKKQNYSLGM